MLGNRTAAIVLLIVGVALLASSLLADVIGIGDDVGFGRQQTMGTAVGALVTAVGLVFTFRAR
ncbi:MAG: hypothetical protein ACE5K1_10895 [Acidiferrobacterales bacterium]